MSRTLSGAVLIFLFAMSGGVSNARTRLLPPSAFPELPKNLVAELERRGCRIPQDKKHDRNVIQGDFLAAQQADWAALCSTKKTTALLVFGNGSAEQVTAVAVKVNGPSRWSLNRLNREQLPDVGWDGAKPAALDHQAIHLWIESGDSTSGRAYDYWAEGRVYYYSEGRWFRTVTVIVN